MYVVNVICRVVYNPTTKCNLSHELISLVFAIINMFQTAATAAITTTTTMTTTTKIMVVVVVAVVTTIP
jgi:hypothetical protein